MGGRFPRVALDRGVDRSPMFDAPDFARGYKGPRKNSNFFLKSVIPLSRIVPLPAAVMIYNIRDTLFGELWKCTIPLSLLSFKRIIIIYEYGR